MSNNFEPLDSEEVVSIDEVLKIVLNQPTFKVREFVGAFKEVIKKQSSIYIDRRTDEKAQWLDEGVNAQVLKYGAKNWQTGKVRIKFTLEFCPDEPEVQKTSTTNQPETSEPESPLDDIRRMQG
ncbi:KGK domain-containing protein [Oscillatoria acuminata]|uniref:KGK domain protein n=1 Tax=Oscillatoria acuminata PCC 6304 TaxID=56110 RepID=K9TNI0_9CYAN|nr:KGK domain-containing protein [Oscillatoria acuminata]AFY83953.1 KGK domain protein [Oscillatoria acuminata PCC 6304]